MDNKNDTNFISGQKQLIIEKNSILECYLGDETKTKKSECIMKELENLEGIRNYEYKIGENTYNIMFPIPSKKIKVITKTGKIYKSTVYFIDDIKNIIAYLKMDNPTFKDRYNDNIKFINPRDYELFLFTKESNEIKDISDLEIDFLNLEKEYNTNFTNFTLIKNAFNLKEINRNINVYTKIDNIDKEQYYLSENRRSLKCEIDKFYENKERNKISDLIYGLFGNYASGKSIFLMDYNYEVECPSIYLNLKILKKARETKGFISLLTSELMNFFFKLGKKYKDYENFVNQIIPNGNVEFNQIILSIIDKLKENDGIIILDQYQENIFINDSFILKMKKYLYDKSSKLKIIIASSMNNGSIRDAYIKLITNGKINEKDSEVNDEKNKNNNYIPYHFVERLIDNELMEKKINKEDNKYNDKFKETIKMFNYLPLYFSLCKQNINNLDSFISTTKIRINDKINAFLKKDDNLGKIDEIRKMINNEIEVCDLSIYSNWIPFKYFYIEILDNKRILRCYFPLVKEIWIENIMNKTVNLFDGEINYDGSVIGSLLELNLVIKLKQKKLNTLDINSIVQVDCLNEMKEIIETDTNDFQNKNILITQKNQNGKNFDLGYIKGNKIDKPRFVYIQVKKGNSNNKIDLQHAKLRFNETKHRFKTLFNLDPEDCNLIYISIVNDKINKALTTHNNYKIDKNKKVGDLGKDINSIVYSINSLENFCLENSILLYYFNPNNNTFYIKDNNNKFSIVDLDLFKNKDDAEFSFRFNVSHLYSDFNKNKKQCQDINSYYLKIKRNINKPKDTNLKYNLDGLEADFIFNFAEKYFKTPSIYSYINFEKNQINSEFAHLPKTKALICLKKSELGKYNIVSLIFKNSLYQFENENFTLEKMNVTKINYDSNYDFIVVINFDGLNEIGKKKIISKKTIQ